MGKLCPFAKKLYRWRNAEIQFTDDSWGQFSFPVSPSLCLLTFSSILHPLINLMTSHFAGNHGNGLVNVHRRRVHAKLSLAAIDCHVHAQFSLLFIFVTTLLVVQLHQFTLAMVGASEPKVRIDKWNNVNTIVSQLHLLLLLFWIILCIHDTFLIFFRAEFCSSVPGRFVFQLHLIFPIFCVFSNIMLSQHNFRWENYAHSPKNSIGDGTLKFNLQTTREVSFHFPCLFPCVCSLFHRFYSHSST